MANEGFPSPPFLTGSQILARLASLGAAGVTFGDDVFRIKGSSDATKLVAFEVDGLTAGTTRTITVPDASGTLPLLGLAQTWSATQTFGAIDASSIGATTRGTGLFTTLGANGVVSLTKSSGVALAVSSTDASTSPTTGSATFSGGIGVAGASVWRQTNATTAAADTIITFQHRSSGTPAAGFGSRFHFQLASTTTNERDAASIIAEWATATDASRTGRGRLTAWDATTERECIRFESSGSAPLIGFFGASAVAQQGAEVDPDTVQVNLGLKASGGATSRRRMKLVTGLNFNSANTDVATITGMPAKWRPTSILVFEASTNLTTATVDWRTASGGGGSSLVSTNSLTACTAASKIATPTVVTTDYITATTVYIRCLAAQGSAATASVMIEYVDLT